MSISTDRAPVLRRHRTSSVVLFALLVSAWVAWLTTELGGPPVRFFMRGGESMTSPYRSLEGDRMLGWVLSPVAGSASPTDGLGDLPGIPRFVMVIAEESVVRGILRRFGLGVSPRPDLAVRVAVRRVGSIRWGEYQLVVPGAMTQRADARMRRLEQR